MCEQNLFSDSCSICPRKCGVRRSEDESSVGVCGVGSLPLVARAAAHMWEEPCISGTKGSGTVFFSGCNLKCVFCQNREISRHPMGERVTAEKLSQIYFSLYEAGVHNINLVTPTHCSEVILRSLENKPPIPFVYNSGGYDSPETLAEFKGKIDIYMPDMKYSDPILAAKYSAAPDYPEVSRRAVLEMYRQVGRYKLSKDGILEKGVIIRHLILPGALENTFGVIDWISENFPRGSILFSLMTQYTPMDEVSDYEPLARRLTDEECAAAEEYLMNSRITDGFLQERESAVKDYIPPFKNKI